jgi:hypothetical protein
VSAKILTIDIETQRAIVETFDLWPNFIHIDRVVRDSRILCFAAKWRGSDDVIFKASWDDDNEESYLRMIESAWDLLNEADIVVTWNGDRFDLQWLQSEFLRLKLGRPFPYKSLDLIKVLKTNFRKGLLSMKLDWSARKILGDKKLPHGGTDLWHDIRYGTRTEKRAAQKTMREYCEKDTVLTGRLLEEYLPWSKLNLAMYEDLPDDGVPRCVQCSSANLKKDGTKFYATAASFFQMWRCKDCDATSKGKRTTKSTELRPV